MGSGGIVPSFLISALDGDEWFSFMHQLLFSLGKESTVPIVQEAGWAPGPSLPIPYLKHGGRTERKEKKNCVILSFVLNEYETHCVGRTQTKVNREQGDKILQPRRDEIPKE
jgi:hypothetical protein